MSSIISVPDGADERLRAWVDDPDVAAALQASEWKSAFAKYTYLEIPDAPPFARLTKPLAEANIAVVTTGGIYIDGEQQPFDAADVYGDASIRLIPTDIPLSRLKLAHDHYDHTVPDQDQRTINPVEHLHALAADGFIGDAVSPQISAHGYIPDWTRVIETLIPAVLKQLTEKPADGVLLVPV